MSEPVSIRFLPFMKLASPGERSRGSFPWTWSFVLGCVVIAAAASSASAQISYRVSPASLSITFGATNVGMASSSKIISITNTGTSSFTVSTFSISPSQFQLFYGYAPIVLGPGQAANFALTFVPNSAITYYGRFSMTISGVNDPIIISLAGTGQTTGAIMQVSPASLSFGNVPVGGVSAPQTVTLKNVGTSKVTLSSIVADPPFTVVGAQLIALNPGMSTSFQVTFTSTGIGTSNDVLVIQYNVLTPNGIDLTGTGIAPTSLAVSNYPVLPAATQSATYSANLSAAGGVGDLSWTLAFGSVLPLGLSLSSAGVVTGTLDPSVSVGNYNFSVWVTDSNTPPSTASLQFTLPVAKPTGSSCSNISWPLNNSGPPLVPITDLGTQLYLGSQGGLYPNGSNVRPASHDADGVAIAQGIQPLDANGNYDPKGKYALMSVGLSVTFDDFAQFMMDANADPMKNSHLVLVPGAQPKAGAKDMASSTSPFWAEILNYYLPQSGVTANQVVAAWVMDVIANPTGSFPSDMASLQNDLEKMTQNLHIFFPNLKLAYFTSRYYGGYSYGVRDPADVEPYAYQSGFAVKWAIQDQLNGLPALNYDPAQGPVMAPWMAWAHYDWANGLLPRSDGLVWTCQDIQSDGTHPSNPAGRQKDSNLMMKFFKSDSTTMPWFLAPGVK
jgi:hypothetical protein